MEPNTAALLTALGTSALIQAAKDHLEINMPTLRWAGAILGGVAAGLVAAWAGAEGMDGLATAGAIGAVGTAGTHSLLLQKAVLGSIFKAMGAAFFKPPKE